MFMQGDVYHISSTNRDDGRTFNFNVTEDNEGTCNRCGEAILWCTTRKGKKMPIDIPKLGSTDTSSHFDTCHDRNVGA
jgi:hypothetical protein